MWNKGLNKLNLLKIEKIQTHTHVKNFNELTFKDKKKEGTAVSAAVLALSPRGQCSIRSLSWSWLGV